MEDKTYSWIESYLDGQLEGKEKSDFEAKMANDPEFQNMVQLHIASRQALREIIREDLQSRMKDWDRQWEKENKVSNSPKSQVRSIGRSMFKYGIAASFLAFVVAASYVFFESPQYGEDVFAELNQPHTLTVERNLGDSPSQSMDDVLLLYQSKNYEEALDAIEELEDPSSEEKVELLFLIADIEYRLGNLESSRAVYQSLLVNEQLSEWQEDKAEWYNLLIGLEISPFDSLLLQNLEKMANNPDHLYQNAAARALNKTESFMFRSGRLIFGN